MPALSHALRALRQRPGYTASVLSAIAIGFALPAAVRAVVDCVLFKPLNYPEARQLVEIQVSSTRSRIPPTVPLSDLVTWGKTAPGVGFTAFRVAGPNESTWLAYVQPNFFDV